ncbi:MAG: hypothetical protein ABSH45_20015 [Bryobacteraceae bacterium]
MRRPGIRKFVNNLMLAATGVCTLLTVSVLFVILGYLAWNGGKSIDWDFLTKLPLPQGQVGGGMANAIVGSAIMVGLAAAIGLPVGFLGGIYLAEFGNKSFAAAVRYMADLLNGVPSIVIGAAPSSFCSVYRDRFAKAPWRWALRNGKWWLRWWCPPPCGGF